MNDINNTKRNRNLLSPEEIEIRENKRVNMGGNSDSVGQMSISDLMDNMRKVIREEMEPLKKEVETMKTEISKIATENSILKNEVARLKNRMENLERDKKKNNLIIRGIKKEGDAKEKFYLLCTKELKMEQKPKIRNVFEIKSMNNKAILKVEFESEEEMWKVLSKTRNLKGTDIAIDRDLTKEARERRNNLIKIKKEIIKVDTSKKITVSAERLIIGQHKFDLRNGILRWGYENGINKIESLYNKDIAMAVKDIIAQGNTSTNAQKE